MSRPRLRFTSIHGHLDLSGGAAIWTRELMELLAARGWDCQSLTCGVLDFLSAVPLAALGKHGLSGRQSCSDNGMG